MDRWRSNRRRNENTIVVETTGRMGHWSGILTGSASAQLNSNAGQININTKPPRTPWVIATTFQLNMGGTDPPDGSS
jgi:hypothetical protein